MTIQVTCPNCRASLAVKEIVPGKKVRCPHCQWAFPVEKPTDEVAGVQPPSSHTSAQQGEKGMKEDISPKEHELAQREARLKIVIQEKEDRRGEMLDYNKRLDRTVVLYLSAVYAAIGLQTARQIDLSPLLGDDRFVWGALLFIFLNACIMLHGLSQSCWSMTIAKFIHIKLETELLRFAGEPEPRDTGEKTGLDAVDSLGFDDWTNEIKGVALSTRGLVTFLWLLLVLIISIGSLTFVNVPHFVETYSNGYELYLALGVAFFLFLLHFLIIRQGITFWFYCQKYHQSQVHFSLSKRLWILLLAFFFTVGLLLLSCVAAIYHQ